MAFVSSVSFLRIIAINKTRTHTKRRSQKTKGKKEDLSWQASPTTGGAYWAISSVVERAPDN